MKEQQEAIRKADTPMRSNQFTKFILFMIRICLVIPTLLVFAGGVFTLPMSAAAEGTSENGDRRIYRALLIGQSYTHSEGLISMPGSIQDMEGIRQMLLEMSATPYEIHSFSDLSADGIRGALKETFSKTKKDDVCLFYYAGHGYESDDDALRGALIGTDGALLLLPELCSFFSRLPGSTILILDSCYSGNIGIFLSDLQQTEENTEHISALCAAGAREKTEEIYRPGSGERFGLFTKGLLEGSLDENIPGNSFPADRDGNLEISMTEAYYYLKAVMQRYARNQHPYIWPEGGDTVLWGRDPEQDGTPPEG